MAEPCTGPHRLRVSDPLLETALWRELRREGFAHAIERKQLAVALVDLTSPDPPAYAGVNDDVMLYAASLPKIGILLAVAHALERGDLVWEDAYRYRLERMINISDNAHATWAAELLGLRYVNAVLTDPRNCLYQAGEGGLWVGRAFRKGGEEHRDPLKGISHGATARQVARFYVLLDAGELVTPHFSRRMLSLMSPPDYVHKFVAALEGRRRLRFDARKSGTWQQYHSDSAIIQHGSVRYVLVGLAQHADGETWLRQLARIADDLVTTGEHRIR